MTKPRMKRVFSSNSQCAHVWAQQTQDSGRANSVFFESDRIYSYGPHYCAARILTRKGTRFALVNSHRYSVTTAKHLSQVRSALNGLMPYFTSPDVNDPRKAVRYLDQCAQDAILDAQKRMKIASQDGIKWGLETIDNAIAEANRLRIILGMAEKWPTKKQNYAVQRHLEKRLARYNELNPPEVIAARKAEAERQRLARLREEELLCAEQIQKFRNGDHYGWIRSEFDLLRIKGDVVETSRGAEVPLREAKMLYAAIVAGKGVVGQTVGDFTVEWVKAINSDFEIKIGCHNFLLSEARNLFESPSLRTSLTVIQGGVESA